VPQFDDLDSLFDYVKKDIGKSLEQEVYQIVKDTEKSHIQSDVYDIYTPVVYERRGLNDGLIADENIVGNMIDNTTLTVTNITLPNPNARDKDLVTTDKNLPELIEYGHNTNGNKYDFARSDREYMKPRPFTHNTIEELEATGAHTRALKQGLKNKGYDIE
jgi:hypothetical protein